MILSSIIYTDLTTAFFLLFFVIFVFNKMDNLDSFSRNFICAAFFVLLLLFTEVLLFFIDGVPGQFFHYLLYILLSITFLSGPLMAFFWFILIKNLVIPYKDYSKFTNYAFWLVQLVNLFVVIYSFTGKGYYVIKSDNVYSRGPLFFIQTVLVMLYIIPTLVITIKNRVLIEKENQAIFFNC